MVAQSATSDFDATALNARQAALRLFVEDIADHVMARQLPESYLEAERAVRAVTVSDRFLQAVPAEVEAVEDAPSTPSRSPSPANAGEDKEEKATPASASPVRDPYRLRLRGYADKVMEAATYILKPDSFLEAERAQRYAWSANRMLIQLYAPPVARPTDSKWLGDRSALRPKVPSQKRHDDQPGADEDEDDDGDYEKYVRMIIERRDLKSDWQAAVAAGKNPPPLVLPYEDNPGLKEFWVQLWLKKLKPYQAVAEREAREAGKPWPPPHWSRPVETWFPNATPEDLDMFRPKPPPDTP